MHDDAYEVHKTPLVTTTVAFQLAPMFMYFKTLPQYVTSQESPNA